MGGYGKLRIGVATKYQELGRLRAKCRQLERKVLRLEKEIYRLRENNG